MNNTDKGVMPSALKRFVFSLLTALFAAVCTIAFYRLFHYAPFGSNSLASADANIQYLDFYAYSPISSSQFAKTDYKTFTITPSNTVSEQVDFIYANTKNKGKGTSGEVTTLNFRHAGAKAWLINFFSGLSECGKEYKSGAHGYVRSIVAF